MIYVKSTKPVKFVNPIRGFLTHLSIYYYNNVTSTRSMIGHRRCLIIVEKDNATKQASS